MREEALLLATAPLGSIEEWNESAIGRHRESVEQASPRKEGRVATAASSTSRRDTWRVAKEPPIGDEGGTVRQISGAIVL